jgi:RNA polymerase sigma factor (sigma-70 family)
MTSRKPEPSNPKAELEALVREHQTALLRYAYRMVRDWELAQDLVQEAFVRYLRSPLEYGEPGQKAAWLFRVTRNLCIDVSKRESRRDDVQDRARKPTDLTRPDTKMAQDERAERLEELLSMLNENQRTVLLLFFQEQHSYKEIAEITGFSMSNVGMLIHRGLKKLRELMDEKEWKDLTT